VEGDTAQRVLARERSRGMTIDAAGAVSVVVVAIVAWPLRSAAPGIGGDWGWVAALSYAAEHGLDFGSQVVWTYGPLGFLETWYGATLYYPETFVLAWVYEALLQLLLAGALLAALRRSLPLAAAALVAAIALALAPEVAVALGFAWCALALTRDDDARRGPFVAAFPYALGALTGVAVLGKLNQGAELLALAILTLVALRTRRDALAFVGALLASAAAGWIVTGQRLSDAWPYLRDGAQTIAGYAAAMGIGDPRGWTYAAALAIGVLALGLAWDVGRGAPPRRRWGLVALCLVYVAFNFKEGFVLQDTPHMTAFFGDVTVLFAMLLGRATRHPWLLGTTAASVVALGAIVGGHELVRTLNPYANAKAVVDQVGVLASAQRRDRIIADLRARIASLYQVDPQLLVAVGPRPVMLWPYLYGEIAWAYGLHLRPLVGMEPYGTYTPRLDDLGARLLASERAPQRILRASVDVAPALGGRFATFEAPRATLEIFCRYRQIASTRVWHVLARSPSRCGAARTLATTRAGWGERVPVPRPRRREALVLAQIDGASPHGIERLQELALRPSRRWISLDGTRFRLVAATAPDGLLIRAPRAADYPRPFAMARNPRAIAVGRDGGEPDGELRYVFVEVPLRSFAL
jgi:hypothetical protein